MTFKQFLTESEDSYKSEIKQTISKLPAKHAALIKGFKFNFKGGNTLPNDNEHVGCIDTKAKTVTIASPWNYGREFTLLHELAHLVWATLEKPIQDKWAKVVKKTKEDHQNQNPEELFCHAYANTYAKNKIVIHDHEQWEKFIKGLK